MKAINLRHFNPDTMPYQETQVVARYDYYLNLLELGEKKVFMKPNGKLVYIMCRTHKVEVPREALRRTVYETTQMARTYFQQDDMMETRTKTRTYCDKAFITQQKQLVGKLWNLE